MWCQFFAKGLEVSAIRERPVQRCSGVFCVGFVVVEQKPTASVLLHSTPYLSNNSTRKNPDVCPSWVIMSIVKFMLQYNFATFWTRNMTKYYLYACSQFQHIHEHFAGCSKELQYKVRVAWSNPTTTMIKFACAKYSSLRYCCVFHQRRY